jgi:hypothetical protein
MVCSSLTFSPIISLFDSCNARPELVYVSSLLPRRKPHLISGSPFL